MHADVELRLPADSAHVSVLRATTVSLAARLDFTIDDIEDLRMAVGEASAMVLPSADPDADMRCEFFTDRGEMRVRVTVPSGDPQPVGEDSFAWQVLHALAADMSTEIGDGTLSVSLTMRSSVTV